MGPHGNRRRHLVASAVLVAVLAAYAVWTVGHSTHYGTPAPIAAVVAPTTTTTPTTAVATLPSFLRGKTSLLPPRDVVTGPLDPMAVATAWLEEDRGEPMGLGAGAKVPDELRHYDDRRRFLAVQMAAAEEADTELPHDDAAVVRMMSEGKLVELPALTPHYVLYQVGDDTTDNPMAHYDVKARQDVPLFASEAELHEERARLEQAASQGPRRERSRAQTRLKLLSSHYDDPARAAELLRGGAAVATLAAGWDGRSYDLGNREERRAFKRRLLSLLRPEARDVLLDLAAEYNARFQRLLPVTSLIRSIRYQRRLGGVNANATNVEVPPHSTGSAFDISYRYMTADEQQLLYDRIAQLEREGRVEALRERRNHVHVYVFPQGQPPSDRSVARLLDDVEKARGAARGR